jgi:D-glycero-D-manno-heptose 1,7-bisphosphate phosphatase
MIEVCPHHPEHGPACSCRKPLPGMLARAGERHRLDLSRSWTIGDRIEDVEAGASLGVPGILVLTGYGREQARAASNDRWKGVRYVAWDLPAAAAFVLEMPERKL